MSNRFECGMEMTHENLAHISRLLAEALTKFADRAEDPKLLTLHEMLHEALFVFSDVGVIVDTTGPEILGAWRHEQHRIATVAAQN